MPSMQTYSSTAMWMDTTYWTTILWDLVQEFIYGKPEKKFVEFINSLPDVKNRKAFAFTTSGKGSLDYTNKLATKISENGFKIVGEFSCKAFDTWGPLKLIGGINKGRPNSEDLKKPEHFIKELVKEE